MSRSFLFSTGSILFLVWLAQSVYAVKLMGGGRLANFTDVLNLMTLSLPSQFAVIAPITLAATCGWTLYTLLNENELVAFYSLGWSRSTIAQPIFALSVVVAFAILGINFYLAPWCARIENSRVQSANFSTFLRSISAGLEGTFLHPSNGMSVYIKKIEGHRLWGVFISDGRNRNVDRVYTAQSGRIGRQNDGSLTLTLQDGTFQIIERAAANSKGNTIKPSVLSFQTFRYRFLPDKTLKTRRLRVHERFFSDLYRPEDDYGKTIRRTLLVELNDRLSLPLWAPALTSAAVFFALSLPMGMGRQRTPAPWVVAGILGVVVLRLGSALLYGMSRKVVLLIPAMYAIPLLMIGLGLYFMYADSRAGALA